ncbi:MAG TPA: hypothetical protein VK601_22310 [Kofleriaceae bacterium]|nr:hypothetical protein [Kofleriaceae bacterium]
MTARATRLARAAALAVAWLAAAPAWAEPLPHAAYVARALAAVRGLGPAGCEALDRTIYAAARSQCRADAGTPAAACLIAAGRAACAAAADRARCEAAADVIATNLRGQTALIDDATRMRLVRGSADYRAALTAELRRRYAVLAAELVLSGPGATPDAEAQAIDELCLRRDRAVHACEPGDKACVPSLPWSRCVAALVWFVGGGP